MRTIKYIATLLLSLLTLCPLQARETYPLNQGWQLFYASQTSGDSASPINLPHTWSNRQESVANYTKSIYAPESWQDKRVFIRFGGVQRLSSLFINGYHVGEHRGGATAFCFEITKHLKLSEYNRILLNVNNAPQSDILPTSHEHDIDGGVYRDVELIVTPKQAISPIFWGSQGVFISTSNLSEQRADGVITAHLLLPQSDKLSTIVAVIKDPKGVVAARKVIEKIDHTKSVVEIPFSIKRPQLWSTQSPNLYSVEVTLTTGEYSDRVTITTGLRTITYTPSGALSINGNATPIKGVTLYHDSLDVSSDVEGDLDILTELGATALRSAIYPHAREMYAECDRRGVVAWVDLPLARSPFLSDIAYYPTRRFRENGVDQLQEIIYQNYNHPSIIMWGLFSMLSQRGDDIIDYLLELKNITKGIDPSRPMVAISNQNGDHNKISELIVWRQDIGWDRGSLSDVGVWSSLLHSKWGYMSSAVCYGENGDIDHQPSIVRPKAGNKEEWFPEARQRQMHEEYAKILDSDSLFWGVWLNALFDFKSSRSAIGENVSGVMTRSRERRKDIFYLYKSLWNREQKTLHIAGSHDNLLLTPNLNLTIYSSCDTTPISVTMADQRYEARRVAPSRFVADSIFIGGRETVYVTQGDMRDSAEFIYGSPLRARASEDLR
ncbi:MAG: sugar-binding domain-containing protein [Rikenellaceae bacterium]